MMASASQEREGLTDATASRHVTLAPVKGCWTPDLQFTKSLHDHCSNPALAGPLAVTRDDSSSAKTVESVKNGGAYGMAPWRAAHRVGHARSATLSRRIAAIAG